LAIHLKAEIGCLELHHFPDGETYVRVATDPQNRPAILVATLANPDTTFLPLVFAADALRDAGASSVGYVAPYLAYMRQDKRFKAGEAITSETFARLLSTSLDWMVTVDPHLHRRSNLAEIYSIPANALHAAPHIGEWIKSNLPDVVLIGPDSESAQWVEAVAATAGAPSIVLEKTRRGDRDVSVSNPQAEKWEGRTPVLVDDIISTAHTMIETVKRLQDEGFNAPICIGVHGIFADSAFEELKAAGAGSILTCNTIPHQSNQIDLAPLIALGIKSLCSKHLGDSEQ
jgi:ribose-phosphate pyrophosphokinase